MIILLLILAFLAVLVIRAAMFTPKAEAPADSTPEAVDREKAIRDL